MNWRRRQKSAIGFVPTMGALHEGHLSLVRRASRDNEMVVVSIFVNPTQFSAEEDLSQYPRTEKDDLELLRKYRVDAVFVPRTADEIYPRKDRFRVIPPRDLSEILEGRFRPGHFEGVSTVVLKLFQLVQPQRAYFGEKDFQQLRIIEAMVEEFFLNIKIVGCSTLREKSGLAMSSRNRYLTPESQKKAAELSRILRTSKTEMEAKRRAKAAGFQCDYLEIWNETLTQRQKRPQGRWLAAVRFQGVRLIDNLK